MPAGHPPRARLIAVTGTDTGVGKTWVACALARSWSARGLRVRVCKPLETGWPSEGAADETDAGRLRLAAGADQAIEDVCLYRFLDPVAPYVAARAEGVVIDTERVARHIEHLLDGCDVVLVEGAGGLLAPLAPGWTLLDLAARTGAVVVVVVADRLGCLNHALLTERALANAGVFHLGFVMNQLPGTGDDSRLSNEKTLGDWTHAPIRRAPESADSDAWGRIAEAILVGTGERGRQKPPQS
ncbi:MAG: dethiobiotin synthase [Deltaproteobacteria bacterium]|nr:dethiobiotin synthase [Deltaproteobacteria bacterium]